jgi:hypothetical protein
MQLDSMPSLVTARSLYRGNKYIAREVVEWSNVVYVEDVMGIFLLIKGYCNRMTVHRFEFRVFKHV